MTVSIADTKHGKLMYLQNDTHLGRMLAEYSEYSWGEVELYQQLVRPGDLVIDAGANIGVFTVLLAKMVEPDGLVMAYEPQHFLYCMLCGNLALNQRMRAIPFQLALGREKGMTRAPAVDYHAEHNFGGLSLTETHEPGLPVETVALDDIALPQLRLLKADVEGMEREVLLGAEKTIAKHRPILYVENDREEKSADLLQTMLDMDYRLFWHVPRYLPIGNTLFPRMASFNVLGLPKEMDVRSIDLMPIVTAQDIYPGQIS